LAAKSKLDEAIAQAGKDASAKPVRKPRKVKTVSKRGRPASDTSAKNTPSERVWTPTELAAAIGYSRDTVYKWEQAGLERSICGKGFYLPAVLRFVEARGKAEGRLEADPDDVLEAEKLRDLRARADMREDERDKQRLKLIEVELATAVYEDDSAYVAVHLRSLGARLMGPLSTMDDPADICAAIDAEVETALLNLNADHVDPSSPDAHPLVGGVAIEGRG